MTALLVDIGNSRIKWRLVDLSPVAGLPGFAWRSPEQAVSHRDPEALDRHWRQLASSPIDSAFISNVSEGPCASRVAAAAAAIWDGVVIRHMRPTAAQGGVVNGYRLPAQLGADRWLAAIGAHRLYPDRSLLICSFGTATTIDLLLAASPDGSGALFVGGSILPGFETMRRSLTSATARLAPAKASMSDGSIVRGSIGHFADRTEDAIASGIMDAQVGAVERSFRAARLRAEAADPLLCVTTGGAAPAVSASIADSGIPTEHIPGLVLQGLATVASDTPTGRHPG